MRLKSITAWAYRIHLQHIAFTSWKLGQHLVQIIICRVAVADKKDFGWLLTQFCRKQEQDKEGMNQLFDEAKIMQLNPNPVNRKAYQSKIECMSHN